MRSDRSSCSIVVDGRQIPITWSKRGGGKTDSQESKHYPGAGKKEKALGGQQTVDNVTLEGEFIPELHDGIVRFMRARSGKGDAVVSESRLDRDDNVFGRPETWTGILKSCDPGEYDASSGDARMVVVEISTHGSVS